MLKKLTNDQVLTIWHNKEELTQAELGAKYRVSQTAISSIFRRKHYQEVTQDLPDFVRPYKGREFVEAGENHPRSKLNNKQVTDIWYSDKYYDELAHRYDVSWQCIYFIKTRRTWSYLTDKLGPEGQGFEVRG